MFKGEISLVSIGNQLFNDGFQRKESVSGRSGVKRLSVKGVKLAFGSRTERTGMIFAVHQGNSSPKSGIGRFEVLSKKFKISSVQTSLKAGNAFQKIQDLRGCAEGMRSQHDPVVAHPRSYDHTCHVQMPHDPTG